MKKAAIFLAHGFEETEAVGTLDVLRRGGIDTTLISITGGRKVTGAHGIILEADALLSKTDFTPFDALVLPGGMPGSANLNGCNPLKQRLAIHFHEEKLVAAICAAPMILGGMGLLFGRRATCYPGFESYLTGATLAGEPVVTDGNVITGKGPGFVFAFALAIIRYLKGDDAANEVADGLLWSLRT